MPRPRYEKLPAERRQAIMEAAAKELANGGYERASLNRILEQANLSKGAAYYYFDNKEDLIATMFRTIWDRLISNVEFSLDTLSAESFWPSIISMATGFISRMKEEPWLMSAAKAIWGLPRDSRKEGPLGEAFSTMEGWMFSLLGRGQELGVVRSDIPTGLLLAMALGMDEAADRWILEHFDELGEGEMERLWRLTFGIWKRLLSPEEA